MIERSVYIIIYSEYFRLPLGSQQFLVLLQLCLEPAVGLYDVPSFPDHLQSIPEGQS